MSTVESDELRCLRGAARLFALPQSRESKRACCRVLTARTIVRSIAAATDRRTFIALVCFICSLTSAAAVSLRSPLPLAHA